MTMPEQKKAVVPRLRFPEFRDAGPWEVKRLGEVFCERSERGGNGLELLSVTISDGVVRAAELERKNNANADLSNYKKVCPGDIVYNSMRMWQGASGVSWWHGVVSPAYTVVTPKESQNAVFWAYCFKLEHSIAEFVRFSQGVTSDTWNLKYPAFSAIEMAFPAEQAEQQKIADCLSSLDELIKLQAKQLEALKAHKKGLMQQLFPREGETTPRLRFPEFRDAGPWEVKRLGDVYQFIPTNSFSREQLTYESGTIKNIHYGDIHTKYRALFDVEREHVPFLIGNGVTEDFDDERFCVPGDVILADASEDLDDIGKAIEIVNIGSHKVVAGLHTLHARQLAEDLVIGFGGCLFQCNAIREQIRKQAQGAKVLGISATRLKSIKLAAPRKPEQQKIADCLSSLDEVIELQAKQLEALQTHKKGLMQQLFPQEIDL